MLDARTRDADGIDFLECVGADQMYGNLAGDDDERRRVHVRVGDAGHRVCCSRSGGDEDVAGSAGSASITFGHVDGPLLVPHEIVGDALACAPEFVVNVQYGAPGISKNCIDALPDKGFDEDFSSGGPIHEAGLYASEPSYVKFILLR